MRGAPMCAVLFGRSETLVHFGPSLAPLESSRPHLRPAQIFESFDDDRAGLAMSSAVCYKCNRPGHFARECNFGGGGDSRGTKERDGGGYRAMNDGGYRNDGSFSRSREKCYKCNRQGHFARDCKEEADRCYRCSGTGHIARDCTQSPDEPSCYTCHKVGHISRNCPDMQDRDRGSTQNCYNCNKTGHISRNCPDGTKTCYNCNQTGHISRDCDQMDNN